MDASLKLEWVNCEKETWMQCASILFGKRYSVIKSSKFCHKKIFVLLKQLMSGEGIQRPFSFLEEALQQDKQWAVLSSFLQAAQNLSERQDFELENQLLLSRIAVSSVWAIAICFQKVHTLPCIEMHLINNWFTLKFIG